jgi:hypothetical protein
MMSKEAIMDLTFEARYDGVSFHPTTPVDVPKDSTVRVTVEVIDPPILVKRGNFLRTARAMKLSGPSDWSENVDKYLYGTDEHGPS